MKIALFYKENKIESAYIDDLTKKLTSHGFELDNKNPEVVLYVGGDGTFLRAVHQYIDMVEDVEFVGLKKGHLGFFTSYNEDEVDVLLQDLKANNIDSKSYRLVKATFANSVLYAVNEIRIESPFQTLISEVEINGSRLETFRGNGLVVASSLGSSAYNKSLGGSLVDHDLEVLQLTEIAPIANNVYRSLGSSLVLSKDKEITFSGSFHHVVVGYDYLNIQDKELESIKITNSDKKIKILYNKNYSFIKRIRKSFIL